MYGDKQTRAARMNRLPPVTLKDYIKPLGYAFLAVPVLYVLMFAYYVMVNVIV